MPLAIGAFKSHPPGRVQTSGRRRSLLIRNASYRPDGTSFGMPAKLRGGSRRQGAVFRHVKRVRLSRCLRP